MRALTLARTCLESGAVSTLSKKRVRQLSGSPSTRSRENTPRRAADKARVETSDARTRTSGSVGLSVQERLVNSSVYGSSPVALAADHISMRDRFRYSVHSNWVR